MTTHSFPVLTHFILICWWFSAWKTLNDANIFICLLDHAYRASLVNIKVERHRYPEKPLILERSGTQYDARVTKLLRSYCRAHSVQSYCNESHISDTNWLRNLSSSYLIKTWLSLWRHQLANLHISKTWISLEREEIFENSEKHFSLILTNFYVLNGSDKKDAVFVIVPL